MIELLRIIFTLAKYRLFSHLKHLVKCNAINFKYKSILNLLVLIEKITTNKSTNSIGTDLCDCLKNLGPIYIKFGQLLSTREDIVTSDIANSLKELQDKLAPFSFDEAQEALKNSLGSKITKFKYIDPKPIAAASIAQVHKATLYNGEIVAIKILRPGIESIYQKDLKFLYFIANKIDFFNRNYHIKRIVDNFAFIMNKELNLKLEAASCSRINNNIQDKKRIITPDVFWDLSATRVLTMSWIDGLPFNMAIQNNLLTTQEKLNISKEIAHLFFQQTYEDGLFHADLHPGNIILTKDKKIALIDFGITGKLESQERMAVAEIIFSIISKKYDEVAKIFLRCGYIPKDTDLSLFADYCCTICEPIASKPIKDISFAKLFKELYQMAEKFNMTSQPQLLLLQKSMLNIEGIGLMLNKDVNMWKLAEPWIKKWAAKNISPEAKMLRYAKNYFKKIIDNENCNLEH